jgi:chorismate dehydratase
MAEVIPRVGRIDFVNCFPLYLHFEEELAARGVRAEVIPGSPAELNRLLAAGSIDMALPSSVAYARNHRELMLLDGLAIGSFGAVDSVQLFSKVPVTEMKTVALTEKSATSVSLVKVLCREWGISPRFMPRRQPLSDTLAEADGLVLIGDEALHILRAGVYPINVDLGEAWRQVTGLPMVFAVCVARRAFALAHPAETAALQAALIASRDRCAAHPQETAAAAALIYDFSQQYLLEYFDKLRYSFSAEHRGGLAEFFRRAAAAGELNEIPDLGASSLGAASGALSGTTAPTVVPGRAKAP